MQICRTYCEPDEFFSEAQIHRLQELMERSQAGPLTPEDEAERDTLIEAELLASARRTAVLADAIRLGIEQLESGKSTTYGSGQELAAEIKAEGRKQRAAQ